jgi:2'-5' RNA ligase
LSSLRRGFLAVVPPPEVLRCTESTADPARRIDDGLRWTRPDQRHVTLQFLGAVPAVEGLAESVTDSVRGIAPFTVALAGAGAFPLARRATVLWLGVSTGAEELGALAAAIAAGTAPHGFVTDDRPFRPHLTLARSARARDLRKVVEHLRTGPAGPPWTVERVVLFDSDTRAEGAVHAEHDGFALRAAQGG